MTAGKRPRVGILGAGRMASGLAQLLTEAGHDVVISRREPRRPGADAPPATSFEEAAEFGDIVVLAIPHAGVGSLAASIGERTRGKVLVDITNAVVYADGRTRSGLTGISNGSWVAARFPQARVTRAYNHIQDELLVSRAHRQPGNWAVAVAGDDEEAVQETSKLVVATHYIPVRVGTLEESVVIDPGGPVFPHMFTPADLSDVIAAATGREGE